jgi:RNA polymerase sigma-70 factor (sigma-E family)
VGDTDDDARFEEFYRRRVTALLRYGYVLTGNAHDAADLVQEAFARLRVAWRRVRRRDDPEPYVRTTMARLHISRWRRTRREWIVAEVPETGGEDRALARAAADSGLWAALGTLPTRQRAVLVLRYYEDQSDEQIAATLGVSRGTVRSQASRALEKLRGDRLVPPRAMSAAMEEE